MTTSYAPKELHSINLPGGSARVLEFRRVHGGVQTHFHDDEGQHLFTIPDSLSVREMKLVWQGYLEGAEAMS